MRGGELGCFASHYSLWRKCIEINQPIIVLEDDVILQENFMAALYEIQKGGFEYVRLYGIFKVAKAPIRENNHFYITYSNINGTQGYYLTPSGAKKFVLRLERLGFIMPVDDYMDSFYLHNVLNIIYSPYPIIEDKSIESTIKGRDKQGFSAFKITREIFRVIREIYRVMYLVLHRRGY